MAGQTIGSALEIPDSVLKKIDDADKKLQCIQNTATTVAGGVSGSFNTMTISTDKFIQRLDTIIQKLNLVGSAAANANTATSGFGNQNVGGIANFNSAIQQAIANINRMAASLQTTGSTGASGVLIARQAVQDLIEAMKNASGMNIAHLKEEIKSINNTLADTTRNLTKADQDSLNQRKKLLQDELKEQERTANQRAQTYAKAIDRMLQAEQTFQKKQEKLYSNRAQGYQRQNIEKNSTYNGALQFSSTANTLNRQQKAIEYLTAARMKLNTADADYKQKLDALNAAIERHRKVLHDAGDSSRALAEKQSYLSKYTQELAQRMLILFSINTVRNFANQIAEVRGQFEMSQRSLEAILQNKPKADEIFNKTVELAVKSPFQIKDLVDYTRQLSAYRIESDKLYDTTKRLADVSAGLGVDMGRLILAYGQVKAAAYLRGSEVRQFTEAGVNMYGELQSYFKEVKGEAYTTAEIVDMISKRQVTFEDVEQVFKRLTSEGGIFFNMQEIQAETLQGKIANLKDSFDVMFNAIGKDNEGVMKWGVGAATSLLNHWESIGNAMNIVLGALALVFIQSKRTGVAMSSVFSRSMTVNATTTLSNMELMRLSFGSLGKAVKTFGANLKAAFMSNLPVAAIMLAVTALVEAGKALYEYSSAVSKANEESARMNSAATKLNTTFEHLKDTTNSLKGSKDSDAIAKNIEDKRLQLQKLLDLADKNGLALQINVEEVQESELDKTFSTVLSKYRSFVTEIQIVEKSYASNKLWNRLVVDDIDEDAADYKNAVVDFMANGEKIRQTVTEFQSHYKTIETIIANLEKTSNPASKSIRAAFDAIKRPQGEQEEDSAYFERVYTAMVKLNQVTRKSDWGKPLSDALVDLSSDFKDVQNSTTELIGEFDKVFAHLSSNTKRDPIQMKAIIDRTAAEHDWNQYARDLAYKHFGIKVEIDQADAQNQVNWVDNYIKEFFAKKKYGINLVVGQIDSEGLKDFTDKGDDVAKSAKAWAELEKRLVNIRKYSKTINLQDTNYDSIKKMFKAGDIPSVMTEVSIDSLIKKTREYKKAATEASIQAFGVNPFEKQDKQSQKEKRDILSEQVQLLKEMQKRYEALVKYQDDGTAVNSVMSQYKASMDYVKLPKDIQETFVPDKQGLAAALKKLLPTINDFKKKTEVLNDIAELKIQIDQEYLKSQLEDTKREVEDLFSQRSLHLKLKDLGLSESEIKAMFGNLTKTWDEVRSGMNDEYSAKFGPDKGKWGDDVMKQYLEEEKKLNKDVYNDQVSQMQELVKAYKTQLSDQLQLDAWYVSERNKIMQNEQLSKNPDLQNQMLGNLKTQYNKKSSENVWNSFKGSETYLSMFNNLDYVSTKAIDHMREKLDTLKEQMKNLDPTQLKEVTNLYNKMDEQLAERNPLKSFLENYKEIKKMNAKGITESSLTQTVVDNDTENAQLEQEISLYSRIIALKQESTTLTKEDEEFIRQNNNLYSQTTDELRAVVKSKRQTITNNKASTKEATENLQYYSKARNSLAKMQDEWGTLKSMASQAMGSVNTMLEAMGVESDSTAGSLVNMVGTLADLAIQAIMFQLQLKLCAVQAQAMGVAMNAAMGPIGWVLLALQAITTVLSTILGSNDKALQKQIEEQQRLVSALQHAYEKLEDAIDDAFDTSKLLKYNDEAEKNLQAQIVSYQKMIKAERQRKDPDKDQIQEWEQTIDDLKDQMEELKESQIEALGGFGSASNYKSAAEEFAEAWVDAFNEGENALDALNDKFDEYFDNLLTKQITQRASTKFIEPILKAFDDTVAEGSLGGNNGADVTKEELANLKKLKDENLAAYNEYLQNMIDVLGVNPSSGSSELSGLQKGIQSVTENTAEALESILNSVRYYVAMQQADVAVIKNTLIAHYGDNNDGTSSANPQTILLREQCTYLSRICNYWDSVVKAGHSKGRSGIRVFID